MAKVNLTTAFSRYGATLVNPQWAVSAINDGGELVVSCWRHYLKLEKPVLRYTDTLSRWAGNTAGNNLMRKHLEQALAESLPVRLVVADTEETDLVDSGTDVSPAKKTFYARENLIGKVSEFDGAKFVIEFVEHDA